MATLLLKIDGLTPGDDARLERELVAMPGVFGAVVSLGSRCVEVDFEDDEVAFDRIIHRVEELGFEAQLAG
jgi:copper chaperone CopZ